MSESITQLLVAARSGDRGSLGQLFALVYEELKVQARRMPRAGERGLNTTAIVHEAYLKLVACERPEWEHRQHFIRVAARAMRQVIIDDARRRLAHKRGGGSAAADLDQIDPAGEEQAEQLLALDDALTRLEACEPRLGQVIEMSFFAGLSVEDTAQVLEVSDRTIKRDWRAARAFLYKELEQA
jgi:RNA polymerase sigma factor (TIGR02999 family)